MLRQAARTALSLLLIASLALAGWSLWQVGQNPALGLVGWFSQRRPAEVDDSLRKRPGKTTKLGALIFSERLIRLSRNDVGVRFQVIAKSYASVGQHNVVCFQNAAGAETFDAGVPFVARPTAKRLQHVDRHQSRRAVGDERFESAQTLVHENCDMAVAAVFAQQRLRVPKHEVILGRPRKRGMRSEQGTAIDLLARDQSSVLRKCRCSSNVGAANEISSGLSKGYVRYSKASLKNRFGRRCLPRRWDSSANERGREVVERRDRKLSACRAGRSFVRI